MKSTKVDSRIDILSPESVLQAPSSDISYFLIELSGSVVIYAATPLHFKSHPKIIYTTKKFCDISHVSLFCFHFSFFILVNKKISD